MRLVDNSGGGSGIRTRDGVAPIHALQACAFNRSATPPLPPGRPRREAETSEPPAGVQRAPNARLALATASPRDPLRIQHRARGSSGLDDGVTMVSRVRRLPGA